MLRGKAGWVRPGGGVLVNQFGLPQNKQLLNPSKQNNLSKILGKKGNCFAKFEDLIKKSPNDYCIFLIGNDCKIVFLFKVNYETTKKLKYFQ